MLAFADESGLPPVLFLNHADHLFWLGTSVADLVLNLRDAATDISIARRGVAVRPQFPAADDRGADDAAAVARRGQGSPRAAAGTRFCFFLAPEGQNTGPSTD